MPGGHRLLTCLQSVDVNDARSLGCPFAKDPCVDNLAMCVQDLDYVLGHHYRLVAQVCRPCSFKGLPPPNPPSVSRHALNLTIDAREGPQCEHPWKSLGVRAQRRRKGNTMAEDTSEVVATERKDRRSRRQLLAGAAGALGVVAAETIARTVPAEATQGSAVILGQDNTGATARTAAITSGNNELGVLADPGTSFGVYGVGGIGVRGEARPGSGGTGVSGRGDVDGASYGIIGYGTGNAAGVDGLGGNSSGPGVVGQRGDPDGTGVVGIGGSTNGNGVYGEGEGFGTGVVGQGGASGPGTGVWGRGTGAAPGVHGIGGPSGGTGVLGEGGTGIGVSGTAGSGIGVLAAGATALSVQGQALFSQSGRATVAGTSATPKSSVTVTGVSLRSGSLVLATPQTHLSGVAVSAVVPNVAGSSFTIYLTKAVTNAAKVGWFVVN